MNLHLDSEYRGKWELYHLSDGTVADSREVNWREVAWEKVEKIVFCIRDQQYEIDKIGKENFKGFLRLRWNLNQPLYAENTDIQPLTKEEKLTLISENKTLNEKIKTASDSDKKVFLARVEEIATRINKSHPLIFQRRIVSQIWTLGWTDGVTAFLQDFDFKNGEFLKKYEMKLIELKAHIHPNLQINF